MEKQQTRDSPVARPHRIKAAVAVVALASLAGLPWGISFSYSRGYDLFLWIYNAWVLKANLAHFHIPNWSSFAAAGQPFFKIAGLADGVLLSGFMGLGGTFAGVQIYVVFLYLVAALGVFYLVRAATGDELAAVFASGAYVLSWFIAFTVCFQAYLSNFLVYALLPWFVALYDQSIERRSPLRACGAALLLALSITANPQVVLKIAVLGGVWSALRRRSLQWKRFLGYSAFIALGAGLVAAFDVVSALHIRQEILSVAYRRNTYVGPFTLIAIPLYGLNILAEFLLGKGIMEIPLWELVYAEYPGLLLTALAALSLRYHGGKQREVWSLSGLVVVTYGLFFLVYPSLPASEWLGTSHNLMIVPTFALAMLCGYGISGLRPVLVRRFGEARGRWVLGGMGGIALVELYALQLGLVAFAATRTFPQDLPEVALWRKVAQTMRQDLFSPRFFSFNPDHTVYLFPVLTECPTANVIELRQRLPEYESYLGFLKERALTPGSAVRAGIGLAILNAGYVDLPLKLYEYRGPNAGKGEYDSYLKGLETFDQDPDLERLCLRGEAGEDRGHVASSTDAGFLFGEGQRAAQPKDIVQVIYRNRRRCPAFAAPHTVAIVGDTRSGEKVFEELVRRPDYQPERVLYLLVESLDRLGERQRQALRGYIPVNGGVAGGELPSLSAAELSALYQADTAGSQVGISGFGYRGPEKLAVELDRPTVESGYLFVSQQRFEDWKAHDQWGRSLPTYKAGAGLTAVFLEPGIQSVVLQYELPFVEQIGRWVSLASLLFVAATMCRETLWRPCRSKRVEVEKSA
ncbi:MAG: hypothetical protein HY694_12480 [Deltaproteobacteria bacterium]|nr:hypothetical protein [Deltaproteobacteria bacterium]